VFNNKIAPKIIHKIENVTPKPSNVEAKILLSCIPQAKNAIMNDTTNTIGIALFAGHLKPTSNIPAKRIGKKANRAWIDKLILDHLLVNINFIEYFLPEEVRRLEAFFIIFKILS
jgi:hypothetical protein